MTDFQSYLRRYGLTDCQHEDDGLRRRTTANGNTIVGRQCTACGRWDGTGIKKSSVADLESLPWYDESINTRWYADRTAHMAKVRESEKRIETETWFREHSEYLRSAEWKERREKVLRRAKYICEACGDSPATQVHHITYAHWKREPLFDLRAVCRECHEEITEMDRAGKA